MKLLASLAIALLCVACAFAETLAQAQTDSVKTTIVKVGNLHCNGDMPAIKKRLLNQDGIDEVTFTEREGGMSTFTIRYHSVATDQPAIERAIETTPGCDDPSETPYRVKKDRAAKKKRS
jgi:hypothetical protein